MVTKSQSDFIRYNIDCISKKYINSFSYHDLEDIKSIVFYKVLEKIPTFESEAYFKNWVRMVSRRFFINAIRDKCARDQRFKFINSDFSENTIEYNMCLSDTVYKNHNNVEQSAIDSLKTFKDKRIFKILKNLDRSKKEIGKSLDLSRRQIHNILKEFKRYVKMGGPSDTITN